MSEILNQQTYCITHQKLEDRMSPIGLVCEQCKERLEEMQTEVDCTSYWESQPGAYTLEREPCFVYTLVWDHFRIRSLHPPESCEDSRSFNKKPDRRSKRNPKLSWLEEFFNEQNYREREN